MKKFLVFMLGLILCLGLTACNLGTTDESNVDNNPTFNVANTNGKIVAYQGIQQEDSLTFANAINIDNEYYFYYFYLGTISKVPLYTSVALQYQFDTEVTLTFNKLTSESLSISISKSTATVNTYSYTGGFKIGFKQEFSADTGVVFAKAKASFTTTQETDHHWTKNWGSTVTESETATSSYLTQYSQGYSEKVAFSKEAGFTKGNYYRMSFYETVSAYGVLAYEVATNTYSTTTDFLLKNNSTVRIWEESLNEVFDYEQEKRIEFDVNAAIEYAENHKDDIFSDDEVQSGTYKIYTANDFVTYMTDSKYNAPNNVFEIITDLDFSGVASTKLPLPGLKGVINGNNKTIKNLTLSFADGQGSNDKNVNNGLFETIESTATIRDLLFDGANLQYNAPSQNKAVSKAYVGIVAGSNWGNIINCDVGGVMKSYVKIYNNSKNTSQTLYLGGICGVNYYLIEDCDIQSVTVQGRADAVYGSSNSKQDAIVSIGGITGVNASGTVRNCSVKKSTLSGEAYYVKDSGNLCVVGGIIGCNQPTALYDGLTVSENSISSKRRKYKTNGNSDGDAFSSQSGSTVGLNV